MSVDSTMGSGTLVRPGKLAGVHRMPFCTLLASRALNSPVQQITALHKVAPSLT